MAQFMILSLPRSRSCWLSAFLSYEGRRCGHDLLVHSNSIAEFGRKLDAHHGSCETGAMLGWRLLADRYREMRFVLIRRSVEDVLRSIEAKGITIPISTLVERDEMLEAMGQLPGVRQYAFADLNNEEVMKEIWQFCLGSVEWDREWWMQMCKINIQIDLGQRLAELRDRQIQLAGLVEEVLAQSALLGGSSCCRLN